MQSGKIKKWVGILFILIDLSSGNSYVDGTGRLIVDGQPYFIFGFFSDPYSTGYETRIETVDSLTSGGFNTAKSTAMVNQEYMQNHFAHADKNDIKIILDGAQDNEWEEFHLGVMEDYRNQSALLGWYIADDSHGIHPDTLQRLYTQAKAIDSLHITTHSMALSCWNDYGYDHIRERLPYCDILQMQSYPVGSEDIDEVYKDMILTIEAAEPFKKSVILNLQAFSWQLTGHAWGRWPTPEEIDIMVWLGIAAGIDGILCYTLYDRLEEPDQFLFFSQPEIWTALKETAGMIDVLLPDILEHDHFYTANPEPNRYYSVWMMDSHSMAIAINTSQTESMHFSIPVHPDHSNAESIFESRPGTMYIDGNYLRGYLNPMTVQFYRLNRMTSEIHSDLKPGIYKISLYPNPVNGRVNLTLNTDVGGVLKIEIISVLGTKHFAEKYFIENGGIRQILIDIKDFPAGVYFLKANLENNIQVTKFSHLP